MDLVTDKPQKVVAQKITHGTINYCPGYGNFYKNVYAIKMPFEVILTRNGTDLVVDMTTQLVLEKFKQQVKFERDEHGWNCQICLNNLFVSDTPNTIMETLPPILHGLREELIYLNGRFDCHAWQRPVHFGFRITNEVFNQMDHDSSIIFKKDEVVMYVRFNTPDGSGTEVHQFSEEDLKVVSDYVNRNTRITQHIRFAKFAEIIKRVRNRRPKKFLRDLTYGE